MKLHAGAMSILLSASMLVHAQQPKRDTLAEARKAFLEASAKLAIKSIRAVEADHKGKVFLALGVLDLSDQVRDRVKELLERRR